jgi:hypothetical protein
MNLVRSALDDFVRYAMASYVRVKDCEEELAYYTNLLPQVSVSSLRLGLSLLLCLHTAFVLP